MRILLANKFYYRRGGAEVYNINLEQLLKNNGHNVAVFAMHHSQNIASSYSNYFPKEVEYGSINVKQFYLLLTRPFGTCEVKRKFNALLDAFRPDIVHFNNIHSQISPIIVQIAHERGIKTVWTIHDYKLLCPRYDCLRNGMQICELCFTDKKQVLKNRCMKNSLLASLIAYKEAQKWTREKLEKYTDVFICPSQFMANKMIQGGFSRNKITVLCNFFDTEKTKRGNFDKGNYYCYFGRLSHEKGVETLIDVATKLSFELKIIGNGPLSEELQRSIQEHNIEFLGYKNWNEIKNIVGKARFIVIPSEWYENNPLSVIEAQCLGTPVLGANIGGIPELIDETNGMLFESRNVGDLKNKIAQMFESEFYYQQIAQDAQQRYSAESYYNEILKIY